MYEFAYQKAGSVADAVKAAKAAEDGKFLAGGQSLIPTLKLRLAKPGAVVDLGGIAALRGISVGAGGVTIGAMTTHEQVASSADVKKAIERHTLGSASITGIYAINPKAKPHAGSH